MDDLSKLFSSNALSGTPLKPSKGNEALLAVIKEKIRLEGRITFADFMQLALFHPEHGYYNTSLERIGAKGDYLTSPETHPVFGALVARQLEQMWRLLDSPRRFVVVEMGAGAGALCRDIMTFARKAYFDSFYKALQYTIIESSPDFVVRQRDRFAEAKLPKRKLSWLDRLEDLRHDSIEGCFISNELPDAFPVHRVIKRNGELREIFVGLTDAEEFVEVEDYPPSPSLDDYFVKIGVSLPEGCQGEINLLSLEWMRNVGKSLKKGFVITIDYGYPAQELFTLNRPRGTLLCYYKHTFNENPYLRVGQQDITAHVDFSALTLAGEESGLLSSGLVRQDEFLRNLGITSYLQSLKGAVSSMSDYQQNLHAVEELVRPDDLGRLRVLLQYKGVLSPNLKGLTPELNDRPEAWDLPVPVLPTARFNPEQFPWLM